MNPIRLAATAAVLIVIACGVGGCGSEAMLVAAPNLYTQVESHPYANVPAALQTDPVQVVYATDRESTLDEHNQFGYGVERSRCTNYGVCTVSLGKAGTSWEQLVQASTAAKRSGEWPLSVSDIDQRGQFPARDMPVLIDGKWQDDPAYTSEVDAAIKQLHAMLAEQLAKTPDKEVFLFVHGYNNTFAYGAYRAAQIWHFLGRQGVPVLFSWPAGSAGLLRGYTRDRESGEFANPHLKMFLRAIASCPEVQKINVIAHSRGTDILTTAIRELHMEFRGAGKDTRSELKLGQMVLAAPDIDLDVFIEKFGADRVGFIPEQLTVYTSANDKAIGISSWLFGSARRIGQLIGGEIGQSTVKQAKNHPVMSVVNVTARTDRTGHGYFLSSPAVLSDLILVLRDHRRPGAANGRPLRDVPDGFWELDDGYPFLNMPAPKPATTGPATQP